MTASGKRGIPVLVNSSKGTFLNNSNSLDGGTVQRRSSAREAATGEAGPPEEGEVGSSRRRP